MKSNQKLRLVQGQALDRSVQSDRRERVVRVSLGTEEADELSSEDEHFSQTLGGTLLPLFGEGKVLFFLD